MLGGICSMRLGRYAAALVYWHEAFAAMQKKFVGVLAQLEFFVLCKMTQSLIMMHTPVKHLQPLMTSLCALADPLLDQGPLQVTLQMLFAVTGCFAFSCQWVAPLMSGTTFYNSRYAFDQLLVHLQECFDRVTTVLAVDAQRLLRREQLADQLDPVQHPRDVPDAKSLLFRIYHLLMEKIKPVLQRFYFNRYILYRVQVFKLQQ
jgi:hypothetical protein